MSFFTYQPNEDDGVASGILAMIWNKAPLLMRCGGGPLEGDEPNYNKPVPKEIKERFAALTMEGRTQRQIADITGFSYNTVLRHTRHLRRDAR